MNPEIGPTPEQQIILKDLWDGYLQRSHLPQNVIFSSKAYYELRSQQRTQILEVTIENYEAKTIRVKDENGKLLPPEINYEDYNSLFGVQDEISGTYDLDLPIKAEINFAATGLYEIEFVKFNGEAFSIFIYVSLQDPIGVSRLLHKFKPNGHQIFEGNLITNHYKAAFDRANENNEIVIKVSPDIVGHTIYIDNIEGLKVRSWINEDINEDRKWRLYIDSPTISFDSYNPRAMELGETLISKSEIKYKIPGNYKFEVTKINGDVIIVEKYFDEKIISEISSYL